MNLPFGRHVRLVDRGGPGLSCDEDGVALGGIELVARAGVGTLTGDGFCVRPTEELYAILTLAYGTQSRAAVLKCRRGLVGAADALDAGDLAQASIGVLTVGLPDLAPLGLVRLAKLAVFEKAGTAWQTEPRVPAGQPTGGQWTTSGSAIASAPSIHAELCGPAPGGSEDDPTPVYGGPAPNTPEVVLLKKLAYEAAQETPKTWNIGGVEITVPPWIRGTFIHTKFEAMAATVFGLDHIEVSYVDGAPARLGTPGSSRADVILGPIDHPTLAIDLKTGGAQMTAGQLNRYYRNLPAGTPLVVIRERLDEPF
jgi:hypothetical protein